MLTSQAGNFVHLFRLFRVLARTLCSSGTWQWCFSTRNVVIFFKTKNHSKILFVNLNRVSTNYNFRNYLKLHILFLRHFVDPFGFFLFICIKKCLSLVKTQDYILPNMATIWITITVLYSFFLPIAQKKLWTWKQF